MRSLPSLLQGLFLTPPQDYLFRIKLEASMFYVCSHLPPPKEHVIHPQSMHILDKIYIEWEAWSHLTSEFVFATLNGLWPGIYYQK